MSFFNTTAHLHHTSMLPTGATREQVIAMLSDREFFLQCPPSFSHFSTIEKPTPEPEVPEHICSQYRGDCLKTECFSVTDILHALPAGLWDSNVVSTYEITDITDGLFVRIKGPLSIFMDTTWEVKPCPTEEGRLQLEESIDISCSRMLMHTVKSECEHGWSKIHAKMIARLEEEIKARA